MQFAHARKEKSSRKNEMEQNRHCRTCAISGSQPI